MVASTFLVGSALTVLEGLGYVLVGFFLLGRSVAPQHESSLRFFRAWWFSIGANKLLAVATGLGAAYGLVGGTAYVAVLHVSFAVLALSLASLMAYLLYLLRGRHFAAAVAASYALFYLVLEYNFLASAPVGFEVGAWRTYHVTSATAPSATRALVFAGLVLPQVVAAIALLFHVRSVRDGAVRYRLVLVAGSILLWTTSILFVSLPVFDTSPLLQVASRLVGLAAASLGVAAYRPPTWVTWRLRGRSHGRPATA